MENLQCGSQNHHVSHIARLKAHLHYHVRPHKVANVHDKTEVQMSSVATNYSIPMSGLTKLQMSMIKLRLKRVL